MNIDDFDLKSHLRVFNSDKNFRSKIKEMKFNMQIIIKAPRMAKRGWCFNDSLKLLI